MIELFYSCLRKLPGLPGEATVEFVLHCVMRIHVYTEETYA